MISKEVKKIVYARRFMILPFLGMLLIGYFGALQSLGEALHDLFNQEENLSSQVVEKENTFRQMGELNVKLKSASISPHVLMRQLQQAAAFHQLRIVAMDMALSGKEKNVEDGKFTLNMNLFGDFEGFFNLLFQLRRQASPILLDQLALEWRENNLMISLRGTIFPAVVWVGDRNNVGEENRGDVRDPFQEVNDPDKLMAVLTTGRKRPLFEIKACHYLGYLEQADRKEALLVSSDGELWEVIEGDVVGKENWRVFAIDRHFLIFKASDGNKTFRLARE